MGRTMLFMASYRKPPGTVVPPLEDLSLETQILRDPSLSRRDSSGLPDHGRSIGEVQMQCDSAGLQLISH